MTIPLPRNEIERLNALHALQILDTPPEEHFDAVARLAQRAFDIPVALVSMLDADRQWFKARCGIDFESTARELAFCNYTILSEEPLIVEDATRDPRFAANPFVTGEPGIRFYAGAPLVLEPGICVGTLCVVDVKPRQFTDEQRKTLRDLARTVVAHLRLHEARAEVERRENLLREQTCLLEATLDHMDQGLIMIDGNDRVRVHTLEVLVVQIMPSAGLGKPTTSSEITKRLDQIRFSGTLTRDLDALAAMRKLVVPGGEGPPLARKLQRLQLHHIAAETQVPELSRASGMNLDWDFLVELRDAGRAAAHQWLGQVA